MFDDDDLFDLDPDLGLYPDADGDGKSTVIDYLIWEDIFDKEEKESADLSDDDEADDGAFFDDEYDPDLDPDLDFDLDPDYDPDYESD